MLSEPVLFVVKTMLVILKLLEQREALLYTSLNGSLILKFYDGKFELRPASLGICESLNLIILLSDL